MATYTPRLTDAGIMNNLHWYSNGNPYYATGYGMPNCTAYAWGRAWELLDPNGTGDNKPDPYALPGYWDAGVWWTRVDRTVYQTGSAPKLGAIICFNRPGYAGHVAVVEQINSDGSIVTSNSAYGGTYFYTQTLRPDNNYQWGSYLFQGFIYIPWGDSPVPPPTPGDRPKGKFPWVLYANKLRK